MPISWRTPALSDPSRNKAESTPLHLHLILPPEPLISFHLSPDSPANNPIQGEISTQGPVGESMFGLSLKVHIPWDLGPCIFWIKADPGSPN